MRIKFEVDILTAQKIIELVKGGKYSEVSRIVPELESQFAEQYKKILNPENKIPDSKKLD